MEVSMLVADPVTGLPAVLLVAADEDRRDPRKAGLSACPVLIPVGLVEASAIATELEGIELERPATHQLMGALLADAGVRVERIEIWDLADGHFCARVHLLLPDQKQIARDGRPSDALALALHTGAEIHVSMCAIAKAAAHGRSPEPDWLPGGACWESSMVRSHAMSPVGGFGEADLSDVSDEAFGKWKM
jgi:hypothetical protein